MYWDVDVAKIQRAREAVEEARKKKKDYDFEITDMPSVVRQARLGAAGEEEPEVKENEVEELGTTKSEELLRNATIHNVDDMFSDQVDSWTTMPWRASRATRRARQSIAKISRQAIRAEESLLMNKMDVRMYVDFADPYSLELVLGAYQKAFVDATRTGGLEHCRQRRSVSQHVGQLHVQRSRSIFELYDERHRGLCGGQRRRIARWHASVHVVLRDAAL